MLVHSLIAECFYKSNVLVVERPGIKKYGSSSDDEFSVQSQQNLQRTAYSAPQPDIFRLSLSLFKQVLASAVKLEANIEFELIRFWNLVSGRNLDDTYLEEVYFVKIV